MIFFGFDIQNFNERLIKNGLAIIQLKGNRLH
jgi:hypothetical protein